MGIWVIVAIVLMFAATVYLGLTKKISDGGKEKILKGVAIFQLSFEVAWRLIYVFVKQEHISCWWPLYPCNLGGILLPIIALTNWKTGKRMFYLFGFVGACLTFAVPEGIFSTSVFVFPILKSVLQHTGLIMIPVFEFTSKKFRPALNDMGFCVLGCLVHFANSEGIVRLMGFEGDYMFFRSGMPFVIPGVSQYITLSVFALIVLTVLSVLCDIKKSVQFLKKILKKA